MTTINFSNYPEGAENDPKAPYNIHESKLSPIKVEVAVSQSLSKIITIEITDYNEEYYEDGERDENGNINTVGGIEYDFSNTDFNKEYSEQEYSIPELLVTLQKYLSNDIKSCKDPNKKRKLTKLLESSMGWILDESEVIEN